MYVEYLVKLFNLEYYLIQAHVHETFSFPHDAKWHIETPILLDLGGMTELLLQPAVAKHMST